MEINVYCDECRRECDEIVCRDCYCALEKERDDYKKESEAYESDLSDADNYIEELQKKINRMIDMPHIKFLLTKETLREDIP